MKKFRNPSGFRKGKSVRSLLDELPPDIAMALSVSHERLEALSIPHVLVGGNAVVAHGYRCTTDDVDWLVGDEILDEEASSTLVSVLAHGVPVSVGEVGLDYVPPQSVGPKAGPLAVEALYAEVAAAKAPGLHVAPVEVVFLMKLSAWRAKDKVVLKALLQVGVDQGVIQDFLWRVGNDLVRRRFSELTGKVQ